MIVPAFVVAENEGIELVPDEDDLGRNGRDQDLPSDGEDDFDRTTAAKALDLSVPTLGFGKGDDTVLFAVTDHINRMRQKQVDAGMEALSDFDRNTIKTMGGFTVQQNATLKNSRKLKPWLKRPTNAQRKTPHVMLQQRIEGAGTAQEQDGVSRLDLYGRKLTKFDDLNLNLRLTAGNQLYLDAVNTHCFIPS